MSKKNNRQRGHESSQQSPSTPGSVASGAGVFAALKSAITGTYGEALKVAAEAGAAVPAPTAEEQGELASLHGQASEAKRLFDEAEREVRKKLSELDEEKKKLEEERRTALAARRSAEQERAEAKEAEKKAERAREEADREITRAKKDFEAELERVKKLEASVLKEQRALDEQRAAAAAGFAEENRKALEGLRKERDELLAGIRELGLQRVRLEAELDRRRVDAERELSQHLAAETGGRLAVVAGRERDLNVREEDVARREADADAGFAVRNREALAALAQEEAALRSELQKVRVRIASEETDWAGRRTAAEASHREALEDETRRVRAAMQAEREQLDVDRKKLSERERQVRIERELLDDEQAYLAEKIDSAAQERVKSVTARAVAAEDELESVRLELAVAREKLNEYGDLHRRFDNRSPEQVSAELRRLQDERDELEKRLAGSLSADRVAELDALRKSATEWESERAVLLADAQKERAARLHLLARHAEFEGLRDVNRALDASRNLLQAKLEELEVRVGELTRRDEARPVFPECAALDERLAARQSVEEVWAPKDLATFADELRHRLAAPDKEGNSLFFPIDEVRLFLGGLAMSRIILLQGISGTGKTSLPVAFARAVGGAQSLVPVQAGWRDRSDLIGHYNAFENRFHETRFLQALYEAGTPAREEWPFLLILDELNLSRVEHYFADFLSELELKPEDRPGISVMRESLTGAPKLFRDGKNLPIPENTWFIGTANHDESTVEFADKVHDRAFVLELRPKFEAFAPRPTGATPLRQGWLRRMFRDAAVKERDKVALATLTLEGLLRTALQDVHVGWGNRFARHLAAFVPVFTAAGGKHHDAYDYLVAMRLLRKVKDKHEIGEEKLRRLKGTLEDVWGKVFQGATPTRSLLLLDGELAKKDLHG